MTEHSSVFYIICYTSRALYKIGSFLPSSVGHDPEPSDHLFNDGRPLVVAAAAVVLGVVGPAVVRSGLTSV
jgi:hypothetical protein